MTEPYSLEYFRHRRELSRDDLATLCGVSGRAIQSWEIRQRMMGADDLNAIRQHLGLTPGEFAALAEWAAIRAKVGDAKVSE